MNNEDNQKIDKQEGVTVSSIVPVGWKLWALLFKAFAEGHFDELSQQITMYEDYPEDHWLENVTFADAAWGLYIETCKDTRRELPVEIYDIDSPKEALSELKEVAKDIVEWYQKALPYIREDMEEAKLFTRVAENCQIVIQLLDYKPDTPRDIWEDELGSWGYFRDLDMRPWYRIINGVCIEKMEYDDFSHALECAGVINWLKDSDDDEEGEVIREKDYRSIKLSPVSGYGMAFFSFLLHLLYHRHLEEHYVYGRDEDGEIVVIDIDSEEKTAWADRFKNRIDWGENYYLREDSWKEGYLQSDEEPSSITSGRSRDEMDLLQSFCGRPTFEGVVGADALDRVIEGNLSTEPGFSQYRYLYENREALGKLYPLLVRELEYMYQNFDDIVECFYDEKNAEINKDKSSKWRYESKMSNGTAIEETYAGLRESNVDDLHHIFFERCQYAYEYLWQQPLLHSGMVRRYLQDCIVQDEKLLTIIKRGLGDNSVRKAFDEEGSEVKVSKLEKRIEKAIAVLRGEGIIDENNNIKKQSDRIELVRILIRYRGNGREYARPSKGWGDSIKKLKDSLKKHPFWYDEEKKESVRLLDGNGRFTRSFYSVIYIEKEYFFASRLLRDIDWKAYNDKFYLDGKSLQGEDLRTFIASRRDLYVDIIKEIIEKYEKMDFCSTVRIMKV